MHTTSKVFSKKGVVFGYTTSYRFGQLIEHVVPDPVVPNDESEIYRWLIAVLIPDIKKVLKEAEYDKGGNCLIGIKSQLWEMQDDFSVLRSVKGFNSCGSGYEYAVSSMQTNMSLSGIPKNDTAAREAIKLAIQTAGTFSPSVGTDCTIVTT
jgi:hypothetical protein